MNQFDEIAKKLNWQKAWKEIGGTNSSHTRFGDDQRFGTITVVFSVDGDAWIDIVKDHDEFGHAQCFRETGFGGGESERVRAALMILALAIQADNEERPQHRN